MVTKAAKSVEEDMTQTGCMCAMNEIDKDEDHLAVFKLVNFHSCNKSIKRSGVETPLPPGQSCPKEENRSNNVVSLCATPRLGQGGAAAAEGASGAVCSKSRSILIDFREAHRIP